MSVVTCAKTKTTAGASILLADCKTCCDNPGDNVQHGEIWKRVCKFLCSVHLREQGSPAGGLRLGPLGTQLTQAKARVCNHFGCRTDATGRAFCSRMCAGVDYSGFSGWSGFGETGTPSGPATLKVCDTPFLEVPKLAFVGMAILAGIGVMTGKPSSRLTSMAFSGGLIGALAVGAGYATGCINIK